MDDKPTDMLLSDVSHDIVLARICTQAITTGTTMIMLTTILAPVR
jgi:hypothetical protein